MLLSKAHHGPEPSTPTRHGPDLSAGEVSRCRSPFPIGEDDIAPELSPVPVVKASWVDVPIGTGTQKRVALAILSEAQKDWMSPTILGFNRQSSCSCKLPTCYGKAFVERQGPCIRRNPPISTPELAIRREASPDCQGAVLQVEVPISRQILERNSGILEPSEGQVLTLDVP